MFEEAIVKSFLLKIGFVFSWVGKAHIHVILLFIDGYVHFVSFEIGFVLHFFGWLGGIRSWGEIGFVLQGAVGVSILIIRC